MKDDFITGFLFCSLLMSGIVWFLGNKIDTPLVVTGLAKQWVELNHDNYIKITSPTRYHIGDTIELISKRIIETYGFRTF